MSNNMSKKLLLASTALLLSSLALPSFAAESDPVVARVNGAEIHKSEIMRELQGAGPQASQMPLAMVFPQLLERRIVTKLIADKGFADKLDSTPEVKAALEEAKAQLVAQAYVQKAVRPKITEAKIKSRYDELAAKFKPQDEVRARHILVKTEDEANAILKQLKDGTDFAKLAEEKSEDKGSGKQGGDLGYFAKEAMVKPFADAAFDMKAGEVSTKPVKTEFGYHIIKVEDKRKSSAPPLSEVRGQIENQLGQEMTADLIKEIQAKAKIEKFDMDGKPVKAEAKK